MEKENETEKKPKKKRIGVMDIILIVVGVSLFAFTVTMIQLFREYGAVPDTLITCVFAALAGECGIMGWIKTTKDKRKDREWTLEDREHYKAENEEHSEADYGGEDDGFGGLG